MRLQPRPFCSTKREDNGNEPLRHHATPEDLSGKRPLRERMRPETLDDFAGQEHILGPGKPLAKPDRARPTASLRYSGDRRG